MSLRPVKQIIQPKPTIEGAGVKLQRAFGFGKTKDFDPFSAAGRFSQRQSGRLPGGISLASASRDRDDHLRAGRLGRARRQPGQQGQNDRRRRAMDDRRQRHSASGNAQGRHPGPHARLPAVGEPALQSLKMTDPRYQDIPSSAIPEVTDDDGTRVRVICGEFWGKRGPVEGVAADPNYLDISVAPGQRKRLKVETTRNAFAYVFAGSGTFRDASNPRAVLTEQVEKPDAPPVYDVGNHSLVLFDRGDEIVVQAGDEGIRFLLVSGKPIEEPVAWYGPIVMNTQEQLRQAMAELQTGAFIKHR